MSDEDSDNNAVVAEQTVQLMHVQDRNVPV